jgi:adenylate cyclase class 2
MSAFAYSLSKPLLQRIPVPADQIEIEVKFFVEDRATLRNRLISGGACSKGEVFESNRRYDDSAGRLQTARCLLRLRQDRRAHLTFKRPRPIETAECKVYDEYEVVVDDFDRMNQILNAIGLQSVQVYEKRRETFLWGDAVICVDQLPYGNFIEIEGSPEIIRETAHRLQLPWNRRILTNYLQIFEVLRRELGLTYRDLTFQNMATAPPQVPHLIRQFEIAAAA